jgi:transposase
MKFVRLDEAQEASLRELHKNGLSHRERQRAQAILLSARGMSIDQLSFVFECGRDTISGWLDAWHAGGVAALTDAPKSGRPLKLSQTEQKQILERIDSPTPNLKAVVMEALKKGA